MTHYEILGVSHEATKAELKSAYRDLVKKYHPDINPSEEAKEKIVLVNEAFEVLSNYYARSLYDAQLAGAFVSTPREETPEEKYRRAYRQKKAKDEREKLEFVIRLKMKFYRVERWFCLGFFLFGMICTIDYHFPGQSAEYEVRGIESSRYATQVDLTNHTLVADVDLLYEYRQIGGDRVEITFSSVFHIPVFIRLLNGTGEYSIHRTLHAYNNAFSVVILIFSLIVLANKEYTDFRLTSGLVPLLLVIFLVLFIATSPSL